MQVRIDIDMRRLEILSPDDYENNSSKGLCWRAKLGDRNTQSTPPSHEWAWHLDTSLEFLLEELRRNLEVAVGAEKVDYYWPAIKTLFSCLNEAYEQQLMKQKALTSR